MGDIYISGNGGKKPNNRDIPITSRRPETNGNASSPLTPQRMPQSQRQIQQPIQPQRMPEPPVEPQQHTPKKPKKKSHFGKSIFVLLMIAVILAGGAFGMVYKTAGKIDYAEGSHKDNIYVDSSELMQDGNVQNILLIGVDGSTSDKSLRSDTMLLVSIDKNNKKIKLTSFLRDTWTVIPSSKSYAKLNAAFAYGDAQLLIDTIEYNYNIKIDHYMLVGFDMFKTIIDSVGGIDVEVTEREAKFMRDTAKPTRNIQSGESVHMNGEQALVYCRIRKLDSDFMRTHRQRKVITALIAKAKEAGIFELKSIADEVLPMIKTDISPMELTKLAFSGLKYITYDVKSERVPTDKTWSTKTIRGQDVIIADFDANQSFLKNYIYSVDAPESDTTE